MTRRGRHRAGALAALLAVATLSATANPLPAAAVLAVAVAAAGPRRHDVLRLATRAALPAALAGGGLLLFPPTGAAPGMVAGRLVLKVIAMTAVTATAAWRVDWWLLARGHRRLTLLLVLVTREIAVLQRLLAQSRDALRCRLPARPGLRLALRHGGGAGAHLLRRALTRSEAAHAGLQARGVFDAED